MYTHTHTYIYIYTHIHIYMMGKDNILFTGLSDYSRGPQLKKREEEKEKKQFNTLTGIWLNRSAGCGNLF